MKKLFSALVILCMFVSTTAFALTSDAVATFEADKTTAKVGDVINFSIKVSADSNGAAISGAALSLKYDSTLMSINTAEGTYGTVTGYTGSQRISVSGTGTTKTLVLQNNASTAKGDVLLTGQQTLFTFKGVALAAGKISFKANGIPAITLCDPTVTTDTYRATFATLPEITVTADEGITEEYPTTGAAGQGLVDKSVDEAGNYNIVAKAPIGKKAVITVDGTVVPGRKYNGKPSTSVKVEFVDDTATVITYPIVYQDDDCAVVFGKGTIAEGDKYGIQVTDTTGASKDKEAKANVDGIFGVRFNYVNAGGHTATNGTYKAKAFVNDVYGEEITFTK